MTRTIGASDHKEASCLRDRAKTFVCKMERRLARGDGYGWLRGHQERSRRKRRMRIRKSFFRTGCQFRLSRLIRSPDYRRFRFRLEAGRCLAGRPEASTPATVATEHERRGREQWWQWRRLQHDDGAELGFRCGQRGGSDGRERDGARSDVCRWSPIVRTWGRREAALRLARSR